ncbi:MAG: TolC family protein [Pseudomonadota bacterium]
MIIRLNLVFSYNRVAYFRYQLILLTYAVFSSSSLSAQNFLPSIFHDPLNANRLAVDARTRYAHMPCTDVLPSHPIDLSEIIDHALCHHPQTRDAWSTIRIRAAEVGISKGAYLPSLTVGANISRSITDNSAIDLGNTVRQRYTQRSVNLNVNYVLLDFGERKANLESAKEILTAANATMNETIQLIYLAAAQAYYDLFTAQSTLSSFQQAEFRAFKAIESAKARHAAGFAARNDILQAQTQYSSTILKRQEAQSKVNLQQGVLANAMGLPVTTMIAIRTPDVAYQTRKEQEIIDTKTLSEPETEAFQPAPHAPPYAPYNAASSEPFASPSQSLESSSDAISPGLKLAYALEKNAPASVKTMLAASNSINQKDKNTGPSSSTSLAIFNEMNDDHQAAEPDKELTEFLSAAVNERPALQAARAQTRSAAAKLKAIEASKWPALTLNVGVSNLKRNLTAPTTNSLTGETADATSLIGGTEKTIGASIQIPIFDRFNRYYKRQAAEGQLEVASLQEQNLTNQIRLEVWKAYQDNKLQLQRIQTTYDFYAAAQQSYQITEERYRVGVGTMLELINAQSELSRAAQEYIQAQYSWQITRLKLAQSVGRLGMDKI